VRTRAIIPRVHVRVATIVDDTEAEGPGRRFALWVAGCTLRCPGCCNPEMFDARGGEAFDIDALVARVHAAAARGVEGITVLGGEPFEQAQPLAALATHVHAAGLTVMVFSGFTLAELHARRDAAGLLAATDLLVDGRYDRTQPEPPPPVGRRWIGSANQVIHHLTDAYSADDPRWRAPNTIEVRIARGGAAVVVNGWPSAEALRPRKRP
jgi:anaerobic ribonucleoside-triphosphate reductase activating protein